MTDQPAGDNPALAVPADSHTVSTSQGREEEIHDLVAVGAELLERARNDLQRKATRLLIKQANQRAVLVAIASGGGLSEHASPPAATLQVLQGRVRLHCGDEREWFVTAGSIVPIPPDRHAVDALEDCVFLLTVATGP